MITPAMRQGSQIEYAKALISDNDLVDVSRRPYILARVALADADTFDRFGFAALVDLSSANQSGELSPPLSNMLAAEIGTYLVDRSQNRHSHIVTRVLLSMALDEGSCPQ